VMQTWAAASWPTLHRQWAWSGACVRAGRGFRASAPAHRCVCSGRYLRRGGGVGHGCNTPCRQWAWSCACASGARSTKLLCAGRGMQFAWTSLTLYLHPCPIPLSLSTCTHAPHPLFSGTSRCTRTCARARWAWRARRGGCWAAAAWGGPTAGCWPRSWSMCATRTARRCRCVVRGALRACTRVLHGACAGVRVGA